MAPYPLGCGCGCCGGGGWPYIGDVKPPVAGGYAGEPAARYVFASGKPDMLFCFLKNKGGSSLRSYVLHRVGCRDLF
jgi:hypothetical protein